MKHIRMKRDSLVRLCFVDDFISYFWLVAWKKYKDVVFNVDLYQPWGIAAVIL